MDSEKINEAKVIGQTIGEEVKKVFENNNKYETTKEYREKDEYRYKSLLYFVNISAIISYIAGALALQLPFIDKFGVMLYDFKLYLLIGAIIFVIILISVFISSVYEQIAAIVSEMIKDFIANKFQNYEIDNLKWVIKVVVFIPLAYHIIDLLGVWISSSIDVRYKVLATTILLFLKIYIILSLIFQNKQYSSSMNLTNFVLILIALTASLYIGRVSLEGYLLKDAKLVYNQNEKFIEVILIDNGTIYYKENSVYRCETLKDGTIIEFTK